MKVELQAGDTITIPNGCKATIEDNQIIIEGDKQNEFKDGDILHSRNHKRVVIFANYSREINMYLIAILIAQMTQILIGLLTIFATLRKKKNKSSSLR